MGFLHAQAVQHHGAV